MVRSSIFLLFRIWGTFPFTDECIPKNSLFMYSVLVMLTILIVFIVDSVLFWFPQTLRSYDWAAAACSVMEVSSFMAILISHMTSFALYREKFLRLWTACVPKSIQYFTGLFLISVVITCVNEFMIYYVSGFLDENSYRLDLAIYVVIIMTTGLIQAQFIAAFEYLGVRLDAVVNRIQRRINISKHSKLVSLNASAMSAYGWQILFSIFLVTTSFVRMAYDIYESLLNHQTLAAGFTLGNMLLKICQLLIFVHVCEKNNAKVEAFNDELFKLMRENSHFCKNNKLFLYVTMKQTVNFTACGFFNMGYPLVTSIIAAAATYLVIVVQFSTPQNEDHTDKV